MFQQITLVALICSCLFRPALTQAQTTQLGQLAASMQPGTWAELTTNNINQTLAQTIDGATGNILPYSEGMVWDPNSQQVLFIGSDHIYDNGADYPRFVAYSANTNSWQIMPRPSWFSASTMHAYDHNTINPATGDFYHRPMTNYTIHKYNIPLGTWTTLPSPPISGYPSCCDALSYFPEMGGLVFVNGAGVFLYKDSTNQWTALSNNSTYATYHGIAEYNPVNKVVVFGGGSDPQVIRKLYKLDASGQITPLGDAPVNIEVPRIEFTVDPVSGDYLVFTNNQQFYTYNVITDTWQLRSSSVPIWISSRPGDAVLTLSAVPISTYDVTMFVSCDSGCKVYLYKHTGGGQTTTPPNSPTNLIVG